jgi:hypothetical protein
MRQDSHLEELKMSANLCRQYPTFIPIWTHHLLPFLLPSERHTRSWWTHVVLRQLFIISEMRTGLDEQDFFDHMGLWMISHRPRPHLLNMYTNHKHDNLIIEIWCWTWSECDEKYFSDYWKGDMFSPSELAFHSNPDVLEDRNRIATFLRFKVCVLCYQENEGRMCMFQLREKEHITFPACRSHTGMLVQRGVIYQGDGKYYGVQRVLEDDDVMEDTMSIRASICE